MTVPVLLDLSPAQIRKLANGHSVQVRMGNIGKGAKYHVSDPNAQKLLASMRKNKGCRIQLGEDEISGSGLKMPKHLMRKIKNTVGKANNVFQTLAPALSILAPEHASRLMNAAESANMVNDTTRQVRKDMRALPRAQFDVDGNGLKMPKHLMRKIKNTVGKANNVFQTMAPALSILAPEFAPAIMGAASASALVNSTTRQVRKDIKRPVTAPVAVDQIGGGRIFRSARELGLRGGNVNPYMPTQLRGGSIAHHPTPKKKGKMYSDGSHLIHPDSVHKLRGHVPSYAELNAGHLSGGSFRALGGGSFRAF